MPLTEIQIRKAKPTDKPLKLSDGKGLYLLLNPTGSKLWRWKYRVDGKEKLMTLGAYPDMSLAQARMRHEDERRVLLAGIDPMAQRKADKHARQLAADNSFATVAGLWWASWKAARSDNHVESVMRRLKSDVFPAIGTRPIAEIEAPELVRMAKAIEARGALDIAKRALQTTGQVFRYAIAHGLATRNPAADIKPSDVLASRKKENYARLDAKELPELVRKIEGYQGTPTTRLAIKLMALTFVRTSELIGARWAEFDLDAALWVIPPERMKMRAEHRVPLSRQAVEVLRSMQALSGGRELAFPSPVYPSKPLSENTFNSALARMGYKNTATAHGFRALFSTVANECGWNPDVIERQLAHKEQNEIRAAYHRSTYMKDRERLMQWWSDYLDGRKAGNVVKMPTRAA